MTLRWSHHELGVTPLWNQTPTEVIMCTWVGFRPIYWKCWSNNVVSTILWWLDLAMTLRWPYHDLGITPLWNPTPTHVTMCNWLGFRSIYFYNTLRVKGTPLGWPLVTLSMHRKSADHLKVTWYIISWAQGLRDIYAQLGTLIKRLFFYPVTFKIVVTNMDARSRHRVLNPLSAGVAYIRVFIFYYILLYFTF